MLETHRTEQGFQETVPRPSGPATAVWLRQLLALLETRPCSGPHRSLRAVSQTHRGLGRPSRQGIVPHGPLPRLGFLPRRGHMLRPRLRTGTSTCGVFCGPHPLRQCALHKRDPPSSQRGDRERSLPFPSPHWLQGRKESVLSITSHPQKD